MDPHLPIQFRVDRNAEQVLLVMPAITTYAETVFMFQHPEHPLPDGTMRAIHTHAYMFETNCIRETVRDRIKTLFSLKGETFETSNTCGKKFKNRPMDLSGAWCYGSKFATIAPFFLKNISPEQVEQLNEYARKLGKTLSDKSPTTQIIYVKDAKTLKPTQHQNATRIFIILQSKYTNEEITFNDIPDLHTKAFNEVFEYLRQNKIFCGRYKLLEYVEAVLLMTGEASYKSNVYSAFLKRFSQS